MLVEEIAPTEIGKHANVIRAAQDELTTMDVLVCGRCLHVFHFVEDYQSHKEEICEDNQNLRKASDTKPGIWAFLLWKAAQLNSKKELSGTASWSLYQSWVKLEESVRETWIVAGKTIQSFGKLGQGELQEMPVRITKTVVNNNNNSTNDSSPTRKPTVQAKTTAANAKDTENEKKPTTPPQKPVNRNAKRTLPGTNETVSEKVEKIVAKRFNPRRKLHEYLVKWDCVENLDNSWESAANLEDVPYFVDIFEKQLARQKQTRAVLNAKGLTKPTEESKTSTPLRKLPSLNTAENTPSSTSSPSRPPRTSKTKAMDQVKQWVNESTNTGSASPSSANEDDVNENEREWSSNNAGSPVGVLKRKMHDSDLNDSNASDSALGGTTSTLEDLEEDLIPSHTVKRLKNGSSVSVEVKTKSDRVEKVIKVNGTAGVRTSITGESIPVGANSAEVIITQDSSASGVMRRPGAPPLTIPLFQKPEKTEAPIRVLTKAESLVSNTGIIRASDVLNSDLSPSKTPIAIPAASVGARVQQLRGASGGVSSTTGRQTPTQPRQTIVQTRTPGGTIIQRKTITPPTKAGVRITQTPVRANNSANSAGRIIISRTAGPTTPSNTRAVASKSVTPEEKIFNLSKSGDLKVTKKVMTREELRAAQQQRLAQQQRQPQSQVQIQKVQQIAPPRGRLSGGSTNASPSATGSVRNSPSAAAAAAAATAAAAANAQQQQAEPEEEEHHAQLCPITGKLIGQEETQLQMEQEQQEQQEQEQQQQQLQALLGEQQLLTNEDGSPLLVRGEDGTVYQVAGKNAEGQTILVTQGPDGEQQFAYVAAAESEESQVMTLDNAVAEAVAHLPAEQQAQALSVTTATNESGGQYLVHMTEEELAQHQAALQAQQQESSGGGTPATTQLTIQTGDGSDGQEANIPAEVVQADLPTPGGTRRVVLLLSDGTFMMTEMHDNEFKALNIAT